MKSSDIKIAKNMTSNSQTRQRTSLEKQSTSRPQTKWTSQPLIEELVC